MSQKKKNFAEVQFELDDTEDAEESGGFEDSGSEFGLQPVFTPDGAWLIFRIANSDYNDVEIDEVIERPDGPWEGMALWLVDRPDDIDQLVWDSLFRK